MTTINPNVQTLEDMLERLNKRPPSRIRTRAIKKVQQQLDSIKGSRGR